MSKAIRIRRHGGPEAMDWESVEVGEPGPGEARVRHRAVGINFIDVYHRTGLYPVPALPSGLGMEAAGVVEAVGEAVTEVEAGDRVAYASAPLGAYSQVRLMPSDRLVKLPESISEETAAAMLLQGLTARYLIRATYPLKQGETILMHAAAGGVGLILCQWARALGVTVIGTVGSQAKAELAMAHGCTHTILYRQENFTERVMELTGGDGVPVVYDSVGKDTFEGSLDCLAPRGLMVSYGNASGPVPPLDPGILAQKGSLFLTRPTLMTYTQKRDDLLASAEELFDVVDSDKVKINVNQRYPLSDAAEAHRDLEARNTTGSSILLP